MRTARAIPLLALVLAGCLHPIGQQVSTADWCNSGAIARDGSAWKSLKTGAVTPVSPDHMDTAVRRLRTRNPIQISARHARTVTGLPLEAGPADRFVLARAGIIVPSQLSTKEYMRTAEDRLSFLGSISPDNRDVLVYTRQMVATFPSRQIAVVILAPLQLRTAASRCQYQQ